MATIGHCRGVCSPGLEVDAGQWPVVGEASGTAL